MPGVDTASGSLFVVRDVTAGAILTCDEVWSEARGEGLDARHLPAVLGRVVARDLLGGTPLCWSMLGGAPGGPAPALRAATPADSERLLRWRNDPHTRAMSRCTDAVSLTEHRAWLEALLADSGSQLLIAELGAQAIGVVRLVPVGPSQQVSITVAPEARGKQLAVGLLRAAEAVARALGAAQLVAEIKPGNAASVRAFKTAGYYGFVVGRDGLWQCERRLQP